MVVVVVFTDGWPSLMGEVEVEVEVDFEVTCPSHGCGMVMFL
jgi:hypothetical protein